MGNMNGRNNGIVDKEFLIEFVPICENTMFFDEKYIFGQQIENVMRSNNKTIKDGDCSIAMKLTA